MRFILFGFILSASLFSFGQFSKDEWHDGFLVTVDEDTIRGELKYDEDANVVQVIRGGSVKTFSSHTIFYFEIFDKLVQNYRQFYSIPYSVNYDYKVPILFELLYEGPLSLLARETIVQETVNSTSAYWGTGVVRDRVAYTYYFLDKNGKISMFTGKKADLLRIMAKKSPQVKAFMKKNRLNVTETRDIIRVTSFYNSLI
jgi:hypothetical protein